MPRRSKRLAKKRKRASADVDEDENEAVDSDIQPPANKRIRIVDETGEHSDISLDKEEYLERISSLIEFVSSLKVRQYAHQRLKETETKYDTELQQRENAKSAISPSRAPTEMKEEERKRHLWTHLFPPDILKYIFKEFLIADMNVQDNTVLALVLVCKTWREFVLKQEESDEKLHELLWYPVLHKFSHDLDWKHLVLIPDKYLKLMYNAEPREMSKDENKKYRSLIHDDDGEDELDFMCKDSNIPLLLAIFEKCPRLYSIHLSGELCVDLFFDIGDKLQQLESITFSFTKNSDSSWFWHCISPESSLVKSLRMVRVERSYWFDDEACFYLSHCKNLVSFSAEKPWISSDGIRDLFAGCTNLQSIDLFKPEMLYNYEGDQDLSEAFKELAEKNTAIRYIGLDSCGAFNDRCLMYLMQEGACPQLQELNVTYSACTQQKIDEFMEKRPNVDTYVTTMDE
eukprot:CAMPEP_0197080860 /NCGR_PEP_ID=MMETSP1384-20130603/214344_1 /TAXON_ID=29189 /ORGANISM="Ammonia sp." /LENGTH=457 /DNA_ID=CAMNT_0042519751 /DNA_START=40 /DNA_END=1413 /DNA_ORIENTATION=+